MKRSQKNIVLIILILLVFGSMFMTMNYAKSHVTTNNTMMQGNGPGAMTDNGSNDNSNSGDNDNEKKSTDTNSDTSNMQEPPEKPDGDNGQTPPEKPDGDNDESQKSESDAKDENQASNENGMNNSPNSNNNSNNQMPMGKDQMPNNEVSLDNVYYVIFGIESLVFAILIIYLIMSGFNKKTFKETFENKDKVIISVLSIIILTFSFTYLNGYVTKNYFIENSQTSLSGNGSTSYNATKEINSDTTITSGEFSSTEKDSNAILATGDIKASLSNVTVNKTGDSDGGDNTSFYGTNSAIIAKDGATLTLKNINVTTNATGANGVFSYGGSATTNNSSSDKTTVNISDSKITTTKDNSGGIMTTGGGIMNASNLTISTSGISSAAIRSDRGGGKVSVEGGTYTTTGAGSPSIYSTAEIKVSDAKLISKASEGIVIEGKNSVSLENCTLYDTNNKLNGQSTTYKNIFLYQSMSGDASVGVSSFSSKDSKITTNKGDSIYVTNTTSSINLENNEIINNDKTGNFLRIKSDSWGKTGNNGGDVTLVMTNQKVSGNVVVDAISTLDMTLKTNSYYEGTINNDNSAEKINLTLDKSSKIKLTGNSYVTSLKNDDSTNNNIDFNGYKLYVNGKAIN